MKKIKELIVVEGRSDTAKLKSIVECDTIETSGSQISLATLQQIKMLSKDRGVIIFTDPDYPGMQIRKKVQDYIGDCKHAFVKKEVAIAHGKVGIAEADVDAILEALENCSSFIIDSNSLEWADFIDLDIIGDKKKRLYIYDQFHLGYGNAKTLFHRLNMIGVTKNDLQEILMRYEDGKNSH